MNGRKIHLCTLEILCWYQCQALKTHHRHLKKKDCSLLPPNHPPQPHIFPLGTTQQMTQGPVDYQETTIDQRGYNRQQYPHQQSC
jgi:hypothetical protein